jgi:hypothetical protein
MGEKPELWTYAGIRVSSDGKRRHAWLDPDDHLLLYADKGEFAIGGIYSVTVTREDNHVIRSWPDYSGNSRPADICEELFIADKAAHARLELLAIERSEIKRDQLEDALAPVRRYVKTLRTTAQRDAFVTAVLNAAYREWK